MFERAYAHAPQTLPSHASMFTGLLPFEHKVRDNLGFTLAPGQATLASLFQRRRVMPPAGFVSAYVLRPETGDRPGIPTLRRDAAAGGRRPVARRDPARRPGDASTPRRRGSDACRTIAFFVFFHIYEPHAPYAPPARFASRDAYDGEVAFSDEIVGQLLDCAPRAAGTTRRRSSSRPITAKGWAITASEEHGLFVYNETIRVPLMIKLPGSAAAARASPSPCSTSICCRRCRRWPGWRRLPGLRGRDLEPLLDRPRFDRAAGHLCRSAVSALSLRLERAHDARPMGATSTSRRRAPELYDLERDPDERENIVATARRPPRRCGRASMRSLPNRAVDAPAAVSAEDRERLAALGYVGTPRRHFEPAANAESLPDPKDKVGVLVNYREAVESDRRAQTRGRTRVCCARSWPTSPDMIDGWFTLAATYVRMGRLAETRIRRTAGHPAQAR